MTGSISGELNKENKIYNIGKQKQKNKIKTQRQW